ncbi:MAG: hypothetical protein H0V43_14235 [Gemmatimonadales bacterium]|nr:hypothetical protein [Gemmatimonadales bacterium]
MICDKTSHKKNAAHLVLVHPTNPVYKLICGARWKITVAALAYPAFVGAAGALEILKKGTYDRIAIQNQNMLLQSMLILATKSVR